METTELRNKTKEELNKKEIKKETNDSINNSKIKKNLPQPTINTPKNIKKENSIKNYLENYKIERKYSLELIKGNIFFNLLSIILSIIILILIKYELTFLPAKISIFLEILVIDILFALFISWRLQIILNTIFFKIKLNFIIYFINKRYNILFKTYFLICYLFIINILKSSNLLSKDLIEWKIIIKLLSITIPYFCWLFLKLLLLIIIKSIIIDGMNYSIYNKHYKERIEKEKNSKNILLKFSEILDGDLNDEFNHWSNNLFYKLKPEGGEILLNDFKEYLGKGLEDKAMNIFDLDNSNSVNEKEFKSICVYSLRKLINLKNSILGSEKSIISIDNFLILLIITIAITYIRTSFLEETKTFKDMTIWFGILITPSIILFSTILVDIILNINTFFILRPFDIGDKISIDNSIFISKEVGVFSSIYQEKNMEVYCLNKSLQKKTIINYRKSEFEEVNFRRTFRYLDINKIEILEKRLNDILETNAKCFANRVLFKDYEIIGDKISLTIQVCFKLRNGDNSWFLENRADFSLALSNEISDLQLDLK